MSDSTAVATRNGTALAVSTVEKVVVQGDLSELTPADRVAYYRKTCESLGLNWLTKPFDYLVLDNRLTLYCKRDATDQIRKNHRITVRILSREKTGETYTVTAQAFTPDGRSDESIGVVSLVKEDGEWQTSQNGKRYFKKNGNLLPLRGDELANALMKAETKAKRRVTLSIVGLGWLDETEIETVSGVQHVTVDHETGEIINQAPAKASAGATNHATGNGKPKQPADQGKWVQTPEPEQRRMLAERYAGLWKELESDGLLVSSEFPASVYNDPRPVAELVVVVNRFKAAVAEARAAIPPSNLAQATIPEA